MSTRTLNHLIRWRNRLVLGSELWESKLEYIIDVWEIRKQII